MRFVEIKSEAQLDLQTLHRARDRLVGKRTALINQLRGILLERGIVMPQGGASSSGSSRPNATTCWRASARACRS
jgi:transposase